MSSGCENSSPQEVEANLIYGQRRVIKALCDAPTGSVAGKRSASASQPPENILIKLVESLI